MSSTLTLPENNFTWKKEKPCSPGATKNSRPSTHLIGRSKHWTNRALALVKMEFYYTSRVYYTSVLGAECIAILCSVSRVASASFSFLIFNDELVSSTLTLPVNIFTWKKEKPCSPGARKLSLLVLGGFRPFQVVSVRFRWFLVLVATIRRSSFGYIQTFFGCGKSRLFGFSC